MGRDLSEAEMREMRAAHHQHIGYRRRKRQQLYAALFLFGIALAIVVVWLKNC